MVYIDQFVLPTHKQEDNLIRLESDRSDMGYTSNPYPCHLFIQKGLERIDFNSVTILYGGNGSGKSTLLNLIANKVGLKRVAPFNVSHIFDDFTKVCTYKMAVDDDGDYLRIPNGSRIITSDDVFDYMLAARENNKDIMSNVIPTRKRYEEIKFKPTVRLRGMQDYEELREQVIARKISGRQFVYKENGKEVKLNSNGETALNFFYENLKNDTLFLLDEPENSLSPKFQIQLSQVIRDMARYCGCQFVIATHSPFILSIDGAKIYDLDEYPVDVKKWWELENTKTYFDFFDKHKKLFYDKQKDTV